MTTRRDAQFPIPRTMAARRALREMHDASSAADLLYLENWELRPPPTVGAALRASQIRRANPVLAAEIRAELAHGRPLTDTERAALRQAMH